MQAGIVSRIGLRAWKMESRNICQKFEEWEDACLKGMKPMNFLETRTMDERLELMKYFAARFQKRAREIDEKGAFPYENIRELVDSGYTTMMVPNDYGGKGMSLYELVRLQEILASGDASTALSVGWHMCVVYQIFEKRTWPVGVIERIANEIHSGALLNNAASERETGSPTRGGRPVTSAQKIPGGWLLNGRKVFTTLAPMLDYFVVSASIYGTEETGNFLIPRMTSGVVIEETWDSISMRGTGSHDLVLDNVRLNEDALLEKFVPGKKAPNGGLLHVPACYLGIASAAKRYAVDFAKRYSPNSIKGTIIELEEVQRKIGHMELLYMQSKHFLYSVAKLWDVSGKEERKELDPELGAAKSSVVNASLKIVDIAMRVVGAGSLSMKCPLQRYYRDVRAGLHNPPMDEMVLKTLAAKAARTNE